MSAMNLPMGPFVVLMAYPNASLDETPHPVVINMSKVIEFGPAKNNETGEEVGTWLRYDGNEIERYVTIKWSDLVEWIATWPQSVRLVGMM